MGSMFVVIKDEPEEVCEYKIINKSESVDLLYRQHFDKSKVP